MYLRRQLTIILKWLPLFLLGTLLVATPTFLLTSTIPPSYSSTARLVVSSPPNATASELQAAQQIAGEFAVLAGTREFAAGVVEGKDWGWSAQDLLEHATVESARNSPNLLTITATDGDRERAAEVANVVVDGLLEARSPYPRDDPDALNAVDEYLTSIRTEITEVQTRLNSLLTRAPSPVNDALIDALYTRLGNLRGNYAQLLPLSSARIVHQLASLERAIVPGGSSSPRVLMFTLLAAVVGLLLAAALAFVLEYLNDKPRTDRAIEGATGLRVLGHVSERRRDVSHTDSRRLAVMQRPQSVEAESYRSLRARIGFLSQDAAVQSILVTSTTGGSERSVIAANLALAYAQQGLRVVLVDADVRRPSAQLLFGVKNETGLSMLRTFDPVVLSNTARFLPNSGLEDLTAGPTVPDAVELLSPQRVTALLIALLTDNDLVVIDGPPILRDSDAAVLSSIVDGTVVVAPYDHLDVNGLQVARSVLATAHANALGLVLHHVVRRSPKVASPLVGHASAVDEPVGSPMAERVG